MRRRNKKTESQPEISYFEQKRYGTHLASTRKKPRSIHAAFTAPRPNPKPIATRRFSCSTTGRQVRKCEKQSDIARVKQVLMHEHKQYRGINSTSIRLAEEDSDDDKLQKAFIALPVLQNDYSTGTPRSDIKNRRTI